MNRFYTVVYAYVCKIREDKFGGFGQKIKDYMHSSCRLSLRYVMLFLKWRSP